MYGDDVLMLKLFQNGYLVRRVLAGFQALYGDELTLAGPVGLADSSL